MKKSILTVIIFVIITFLNVSCKKASDDSIPKTGTITSNPLDLNAFVVSEVSASGVPFDLITNKYAPLNRYGITPIIITIGNNDNSFDVAWLDMVSKTIKISVFDANSNLKSDIQPTFIGTTNKLLGFTKISSDNSYVVGYSKDNAFGDANGEFWIARFDATGSKIFNTRIFGDRPSTELWAKGFPAKALIYLHLPRSINANVI